MKSTRPFLLKHRDHLGNKVGDLTITLKWREPLLGLKKVQLSAWGDRPTFLLSGDQAIAFFEDKDGKPYAGDIRIDHFAYRFDANSFRKAREFFFENDIPFTFVDHDHFRALYLRDPDQHLVNLTTPNVTIDEY